MNKYNYRADLCLYFASESEDLQPSATDDPRPYVLD